MHFFFQNLQKNWNLSIPSSLHVLTGPVNTNQVRYAAVQGLLQIAEKGNTGAILAVAERLEHVNGYVQCAAISALAKIAEKGNEDVIQRVRKRLGDSDGNVRAEALSAVASTTTESRKS